MLFPNNFSAVASYCALPDSICARSSSVIASLNSLRSTGVTENRACRNDPLPHPPAPKSPPDHLHTAKKFFPFPPAPLPSKPSGLCQPRLFTVLIRHFAITILIGFAIFPLRLFLNHYYQCHRFLRWSAYALWNSEFRQCLYFLHLR